MSMVLKPTKILQKMNILIWCKILR
jgi:hypothetical protein